MTAEEARKYIEVFRKHIITGCDYIQTTHRKIVFDRMTDEEAIFAAGELQQLERSAAARRNQNEKPH